MQRERGARDNFNRRSSQFDGFGFRGSFPSLFEGKDPFDDPFFTRPFSGLFGPSMFNANAPGNLEHRSRSRGPVIQEIDNDDDRVPEEHEGDDITDAAWRNRNPLVEHPEDQDIDHEKSNDHKHISYRTNPNKLEKTQPRAQSASFQRVTYGGINGAYRTAVVTCKMGGDGVTLEESKHADTTTGEATHRISRGINESGHSITRTLNSNGKVDTTQTLHNLNEDELASFERAWKGNADENLQGWDSGFDFSESSGASGGRHGLLTFRGRICDNHFQSQSGGFPDLFKEHSIRNRGRICDNHFQSQSGGFPDLFKEHSIRNRGRILDNNFQSQSFQGRPKKVVTINIE